MILYGNNLLTSSTVVTGVTVMDGFSLSSIYTNNLFPPCRNTTTTWECVFDNLAAVGFDYFIIGGHNITDDATVTIKANATDSWGSPSVSETMTWAEYNMGYYWSSTQSYRYIKLTITDATNPDTYIEISKISYGLHTDMIDMTPDFQVPQVVNSTIFSSPTGQVYGNAGILLENITCNCMALKSEKDIFSALWENHQDLKTLFVSLYPSSVATYPLLHMRMTNKTLSWTHEANGFYKVSVSFMEVR